MNFKEIKKMKKIAKKYMTPVMLEPIPFFIMSNNIMERRNEAYAKSIVATQKFLESYKKWFSIPYRWEYKYCDNNWLKRHGYPMRRRH